MNILRQIEDVLFPPRCHVCSGFLPLEDPQDGEAPLSLCAECAWRFSPMIPPLCPVCGRPLRDEQDRESICEDCLRVRPFFDALDSPYRYDGAMLDAVHRFKYGGKTYMADTLGPLLAAYAGMRWELGALVLIMPVPLHPRRLRERGFNQSLLLARHVARRMGGELDYLSLRRKRDTAPQTGLKSKDRKKNVRRAFHLKDGKKIKGRRILVVDDVSTTGSTMNECARVLRRAGAQEIIGLVLARTVGR